MRVKKCIEKVLEQPHDIIVPVKSRMPVLGKQLDEILTGTNASVTMGTFYENLTSFLFGGILRTSQRARVFAGEEIIPDIVNFSAKQVFEAKAASTSHTCNITHSQLEGYEELQSFYPDFSISFAIYRHYVRGIKKDWKGSRGDLINELARGTPYAVILPLRLLLHMHRTSAHSVYQYKNELTTYDNCMCIYSSWLNAVIMNPVEELENHDLDPAEFVISRALVPEKKVYGFLLQPFPILRIDDQNTSWRYALWQKKLDEVPF